MASGIKPRSPGPYVYWALRGRSLPVRCLIVMSAQAASTSRALLATGNDDVIPMVDRPKRQILVSAEALSPPGARRPRHLQRDARVQDGCSDWSAKRAGSSRTANAAASTWRERSSRGPTSSSSTRASRSSIQTTSRSACPRPPSCRRACSSSRTPEKCRNQESGIRIQFRASQEASGSRLQA